MVRNYINTEDTYYTSIQDFPQVRVGKLLNNFFYYKCNVCGKIKSKRIYSKDRKLFVDFTCRECKYKKTCDEKYDGKNPGMLKTKQVLLDKYGTTSNCQFIDYSKTDYATRNSKYRKTCLEKYGVDNPAKLDTVKEKILKTNLERYGAKAPACNEVVLAKIKKTCQEKYGSDFHMGSESFKKKSRETFIKNYGVENPFQSEEIKQKIHNTFLKKYGNTNVSKVSYIYSNIRFDSSWELAYYIYLKDNNISFEYHPDISITYTFEDKEHNYNPDFIVNGQFVEIKGDHFFEGGKMINPYNRSLDKLAECKHQCMIQNNVVILRMDDLVEIFTYVINNYGEDYLGEFKENNGKTEIE